jgi:hypothetical protein
MASEVARNIIKFPSERTGHPARGGATIVDVTRLRLREWFGVFANWTGMPGALRAAKIHDPVTGQRIAISVGTLLVRITVNGRDFYFDRMTGRFDGTGSGNVD